MFPMVLYDILVWPSVIFGQKRKSLGEKLKITGYQLYSVQSHSSFIDRNIIERINP